MLKEGSRRWKEVVKLGCGGYYDREGEFNCGHDYNWDCDYCPCCIEHNRSKWEEEQKKLTGETINIDWMVKK